MGPCRADTLEDSPQCAPQHVVFLHGGIGKGLPADILRFPVVAFQVLENPHVIDRNEGGGICLNRSVENAERTIIVAEFSIDKT